MSWASERWFCCGGELFATAWRKASAAISSSRWYGDGCGALGARGGVLGGVISNAPRTSVCATTGAEAGTGAGGVAGCGAGAGEMGRGVVSRPRSRSYCSLCCWARLMARRAFTRAFRARTVAMCSHVAEEVTEATEDSEESSDPEASTTGSIGDSGRLCLLLFLR